MRDHFEGAEWAEVEDIDDERYGPIFCSLARQRKFCLMKKSPIIRNSNAAKTNWRIIILSQN